MADGMEPSNVPPMPAVRTAGVQVHDETISALCTHQGVAVVMPDLLHGRCS